MRSTADYATLGGRQYRVVSYDTRPDGRQEVGLLLDGADETGFDDVVDHPNGRMATVPRDDLDRLERVVTTGTIDGAEVTLYGTGDVLSCSFSGDPDWAETHGFSGSQHDGWTGEVATSEIDGIHETVTDLLHPAGAGGIEMTLEHADVLQKVVAPWVSQGFYEQGYYHLEGPVVRSADVADLTTPAAIVEAWHLRYDGSPFAADPDFVDVLRFRVHPLMALTTPVDAPARPWPTYSNGFVGGSDVIAPVWMLERTRVPAGAELWRIERDGTQRPLSVFTGPARGWEGARGYFPPIHLVGTRATWQGLDVPADLVGDGSSVELALVADSAPDGFEQVRHGVWTRVVPRDDVTELFEIIITGTYRGTPCRIIQHLPTQSRILLLTDDPETVRALGAEEVDIGVFELTVPTDEVADISGQSRQAGSAHAATT